MVVQESEYVDVSVLDTQHWLQLQNVHMRGVQNFCTLVSFLSWVMTSQPWMFSQ